MESDPIRGRPAPVSRRRPIHHQASAASFSGGDAIGRSFQIFGRQFLVLIPLAALFQAVPTLVSYAGMSRLMTAFEERRYGAMGLDWTWVILEAVTAYLFPLAFQAVVAYAVFQSLRGRPAGWGTSFGKGLTRLPNALGASLLVVLGILVPIFLLTMFLAVLGPGPAVLGMLGGFVWAIMIGCAWFVSIQCAVVEGGVARAVARSSALTRGARGKIFAIMLLVYLLPSLIDFAVDRIVFPDSEMLDNWRGQIFAASALSVVFSALQAVTAAVVYHDLRKAKEGVDVSDLVKVFE
jgi:hypothetical protein